MLKRTFWLCFILIITIDQLSKYFADLTHLVMVNTGISFGVGTAASPFFLTGMLGVILLVVMMGFWSVWLKYPMAAGLFFGGGLSNLLDRIFYQGVRDWLTVPFLHLSNNLADWAIVIGLVIVIFTEMGWGRGSKNSSSNQ